MKKKYLVSLITVILSCNQLLSQENNKVINDFLELEINDLSKEILIVKEKISNNNTTTIFQGTVSKDPVTKEIERDGGVPDSLYNKKDWDIMKDKYRDTTKTLRGSWLKNNHWDETNFKNNRIKIDDIKNVLKHIALVEYPKEFNIELYAFSDVIFYKNNEYAVFSMMKGRTTFSGFYLDCIVILKKINGKWVEINRTRSNLYF